MSARHDKLTIISMAIVASAAATLLHEGVGHGMTAWLRGDIPTELTSNHLSSLRPDRWVDAVGTLVNLFAGTLALMASRAAGNRSNLRYFCWILAALNLLPGAGYFLFSGILGFGDWAEVIRGAPHQIPLRIVMTTSAPDCMCWPYASSPSRCFPIALRVRITTPWAACHIMPPAFSVVPRERWIRSG